MWPTSAMSHAKAPRSTENRVSLTVADAALATGLSASYLRLLIARRQLPCVRVGRAVRLLVADVEVFLHSHRCEALGEAGQ